MYRSAKKKSKGYSRQVNTTETVQSDRSRKSAEMNAAEIFSIELENENDIIDDEKEVHNVTQVDDNATDLVFVNLEIKNKKYSSYARALIDGGSTISTANEMFVKENNISTENSDCVIKTVTGTGVVKGKTEKVRIILFKKFVVHVRLFIISTKHDIIIGNNVLKSLNIMAGYSNGQVSIKVGDYYFSKQDNSDDYLENNNIEVNECELNEEYDLFSTNVDQDGLKIESEFDYVVELKNHPNVRNALDDEEVSKYMKKIIERLSKVTAKKLTDLKKCMNHETKETYKIGIKLLSEDVVNEPSFRRSEVEKNIINSKVDELMEAGFVTHSNSEYSSPVFLVKNNDGGYRMVVNYKKLNNITQTESFPLPRIDEILQNMASSTYYTKIDLKSGYHQVEIDKKFRHLTAFKTSEGVFEYTVGPFGLKNLPFQFSKIMRHLLKGIKNVEHFIDDIGIHTDTLDHHVTVVNSVLERIYQSNLKINLEKCLFFKKEVKILGHIVSKNKIMMDPVKIKSVVDRQPPKTTKQLEKFLGLTNYFHGFIHEYADVVVPLYALKKKNVKFIWSDSCNESFKLLKKKLTEYPVLRPVNFKLKFVLHTDASAYAIGAILMQIDGQEEYVIAYFSSTMTDAQKNWTVTEREDYAVVASIKHFRCYLFGVRFTVVTDHSALQWLMNLKDPTGRLARWVAYLQQFDFDIVHKSGKKHLAADYMSRPELNHVDTFNEDSDDENLNELKRDPNQNLALIYYLKFGRFQVGAPKHQCNRIKKLAKNLKLVNETILYRKHEKDEYRIVPPVLERVSIIKAEHTKAHFKTESVYDSLRKEYFWPNMIKQINDFISKCETCHRNDRIKIVRHPALCLEITGIFDRVSIDLVLGFDLTAEGYIGILTVIENLSNFIVLYPIKSKNSKEIAHCLTEYISIFSPPKVILSDLGREFINEIVDNLFSSCGIRHDFTSSYSPSTNGKCEHGNKTVTGGIRCLSENDTSKWVDWLPSVSLAYNTRVHTTTGYAPFELVFGRPANTFSNWSDKPDASELQNLINRSVEIKKLINNVHPNVLKTIKEKQLIQMDIQNNRENITTDVIPKGSTVMLKNDGIIPKLAPRYQGPYTVEKQTKNLNYEIKDTTNQSKVVPRSKLKVINKVQNDDEEIDEILRINNHRTRNNVLEYLVTWKSDKSKEWVNVNDFHSKTMINEYHSSKPLKRRGRPPAISLNYMYLILTLIFLLKITCGIVLTGNFKFCDVNNVYSVWDENEDCNGYYGNLDTSSGSKLIILNKRHDEVNGEGYQCFKTLHRYTFYENFVFQRFKSVVISNVKLSNKQCNDMVINKVCNGNVMTCGSNSCWYTPVIEDTFSYLSNIEKDYYFCKFNTKLIIAPSKYSKIFDNCFVSHYECTLPDSIIVWNENVIHTCPFEIVMHDHFKYNKNLVWNEYQNVLFQKLDTHIHCNIEMYATQEGLFVVDEQHLTSFQKKILQNVTNKVDQKAVVDLQLADADYKVFVNNKVFNKILTQNCYNHYNILQLFKHQQDKFLSIKDFNHNTLIIYSNGRQIIIPTCVTLNKIIVLNKTTYCYKDIPVEIELNQKKLHGFLTDDLIVISQSKHIDCKSSERKIIINESLILLVNNDRITTMENKFKKLRLNLKMKNSNQLNFHHSDKVIDGFSVVDDLIKYSRFIDDSAIVYVETESLDKQKLLNDEQKQIKSNLMYQITALCSVIGSIIITIAIIILIIVFKQPIVSALRNFHEMVILPCLNKRNSIKVSYSKSNEITTLNNINEVVELVSIIKEDSKTIQRINPLKDLVDLSSLIK